MCSCGFIGICFVSCCILVLVILLLWGFIGLLVVGCFDCVDFVLDLPASLVVVEWFVVYGYFVYDGFGDLVGLGLW